jgi:HSP20 family protein
MNLTKNKERSEGEYNPPQSWQRYLLPRVDVVEQDDRFEVEAEMPGVPRPGLEILLEGNELTLIGRCPPVEEKGELIYGESSRRDYRRTFVLDPTLDAAKIEARMEDGVVCLRLPKAKQVKPRKIEIQG